MKKVLSIGLLLFFSLSLKAQFSSLNPTGNMVGGGMGITWINGQPNYAMHFFPEFSFSKFGLGLDLNLEFDANGNLRKENFNEFSDYISVIRYLRYGQKHDNLYVRLGALDDATLGHGSILYLYNNRASYDARKTGLQFDCAFDKFGFETVYSSFGQRGLAGVRAYTRPLKFTDAGNIPILGNLELGATVVSDFDRMAGVTAGKIDSLSGNFRATKDNGKTVEGGLDLGLPVIRSGMLNLDLYFDYAKIQDFGHGTATGFILGLNGLGLVDLTTKFERRFNSDNYIPSYFNSMYEIERFKFNDRTGEVSSKIQQLQAASSIGNGFYGELNAKMLGTFNVLGSYQRLDKDPESGILHLSAEMASKSMPYLARAGYDKINIRGEGDLFKLDDRSYLYAELGYKPMPYLLVSMLYSWTFAPQRDADKNIIDYVAQKKIEPRVSLVYPL